MIGRDDGISILLMHCASYFTNTCFVTGKIMRRILCSIVKYEEITQDISTLEDPSIVKQIETTAIEA